MSKPTKAGLRKLADAAFALASQKVVEQAEPTGMPVIVWEDGEIKRLPPTEARAMLDKAIKKPAQARRERPKKSATRPSS
jgi:hypothetical protein